MIDVAWAQGPLSVDPGSPFATILQFLPLVLVMVIFYFLVLRPQMKRQKDVQKMIEALKKGDRVITSGGMYGDVVDLREDRVVLRVAENVKIEFAKSAVTGVITSPAKGKEGKEG
jgi:preprotein translocase subunit YajC